MVETRFWLMGLLAALSVPTIFARMPRQMYSGVSAELDIASGEDGKNVRRTLSKRSGRNRATPEIRVKRRPWRVDRLENPD
jgi:hypothetical protein